MCDATIKAKIAKLIVVKSLGWNAIFQFNIKTKISYYSAGG
jgi:hypothetical protein